jgi:PhzF family phenazine biosynthesis protein
MNIPIYQVDAFTSRLFAGNPAAVCPLDRWLDDALMQAIAAENNLAETAFFVAQAGQYGLRWFTPTTEVDLCGHATLATAFVIFSELDTERTTVTFETRSGELTVRREGELLTMDFPALAPEACEPPEALLAGLGQAPREVFAAMDYLAIFDTEAQVRALRPDMARISQLDRRGVIASAPGTRSDFVSRYFAPAAGIPEDPVTGSAHCMLTPYWARRLGKPRLHALQVSARGGELFCEDRGDRVLLSGRAVKYLHGAITL